MMKSKGHLGHIIHNIAQSKTWITKAVKWSICT